MVAGSDRHARLLEAALLARGLEPRISWVCGSARAIREIVASGNGCAVMPAPAIGDDDPEVVAFKLPEALLPARRLALARRVRPQPLPALERLLTLLRSEAAGSAGGARDTDARRALAVAC